MKNAPDTSFEGRSSKDPYLCPRFSLGEFVRQRLHRMIRIPSRQAAGRSLTVSPVEHRADSSSAEPGPRALHGDHVVASTHEADASLGSEPPKNSRIPRCTAMSRGRTAHWHWSWTLVLSLPYFGVVCCDARKTLGLPAPMAVPWISATVSCCSLQEASHESLESSPLNI